MASEACCKRPPIKADYTPQGRYETIAGIKTYITGPANATKAIIDIYDIFGLWPQPIQGADIIQSLTGALVLMPDFLEGEGAKHEWVPPDTDEKKRLLFGFLGTQGDIAKNLVTLLAIRKELGELYPAVEDHVGVFGLCWGGKVAVGATGAGNEGKGRHFTVSGTAHPGMLDAKDAEAMSAPHICLASEEEPADVVEEYKKILSQPGKIGEVETYGNMFHGWMGARANLDDAENAKEFERGYEQVSAFFNKHL